MCAAMTKRDLATAARTAGLLASPIFDMRDVAQSEQFRARGLFARQNVGGREIEVPARFAQFSNYSIEISRPAPALSEHTSEILRAELGLSTAETQALFVNSII
jgi:crotonobetainyl-CoA:carnitine CoA-transferase CaiB-like acyl-CoA transferase